MIINLTQHELTEKQLEAGVVEPAPEDKKVIRQLLTFEKIPSVGDIYYRAIKLTDVAKKYSASSALIGGAPYLMAELELMLKVNGIIPVYSFTRRRVQERKREDGSVEKVTVFEHEGFVVK